jgi:hypothetical protein
MRKDPQPLLEKYWAKSKRNCNADIYWTNGYVAGIITFDPITLIYTAEAVGTIALLPQTLFKDQSLARRYVEQCVFLIHGDHPFAELRVI